MDNAPDRSRANEWELAYMRRIGEAKAQSHRDAYERHMQRSLMERLLYSEEMSRPYRTEERVLRHADEKWEEMRNFYARARALGMIRDEAEPDVAADEPPTTNA